MYSYRYRAKEILTSRPLELYPLRPDFGHAGRRRRALIHRLSRKKMGSLLASGKVEAMQPESDNNLRLEIGHVLFNDLVGYSKLLNEEQKEGLNQLIEIVRGRLYTKREQATK